MLSQIARGIGSLLFPAACPGCGISQDPGEAVSPCPACLGRMPRCGAPWLPGAGALDRSGATFLYDSLCRELVLAYKYRGLTSLAPFFARQLAPLTPTVHRLLPVPLHPVRQRERGFNQAELLAEALSTLSGLPCESRLLVRTRPTRPQAELDREERGRNLRGAFDLRPGARLKGLDLLLIDDVYTTGATARACAELLKTAGASTVSVLTAARD